MEASIFSVCFESCGEVYTGEAKHVEQLRMSLPAPMTPTRSLSFAPKALVEPSMALLDL